jgi:hypothetical protein
VNILANGGKMYRKRKGRWYQKNKKERLNEFIR